MAFIGWISYKKNFSVKTKSIKRKYSTTRNYIQEKQEPRQPERMCYPPRLLEEERREKNIARGNWKNRVAEAKHRILPNMGRVNYAAFFPFLFANFDPFRRGLLSWHELQTELGRLRDFLVRIRGRGFMISFLGNWLD